MSRPGLRSLALVGLLTVGWSLACSGVDAPTDGVAQPEPEPEPDPVPRPDPAPNAGKCKNFQGANLPMQGGVIVDCGARKVTIDHPEGDALKLRWEYAGLFKKAGWQQGDPINNNPSVVKYPDVLVFKARPNQVTIELQGDGKPGR